MIVMTQQLENDTAKSSPPSSPISPTQFVPMSSTHQLQRKNTMLDTYAKPSDIQEKILQELRQLNRVQVELAADEPLKSQALWNFLLQVLGLVAGILFGVFAIMAWYQTIEANNIAIEANKLAIQASDLSSLANQIALGDLCKQYNDGICSEIIASASSSMSSYASQIFNITAVSTSASSTTSVQPGSSVSPAPSSVGPLTSNGGSTTVQSTLYPTTAQGSAVVTTSTTSTATVSPTSAGPNPSSSINHGGLDKAQIAGIVVGTVLGLLLLFGAAWTQYVTYKKKEGRSRSMRELVKAYRSHREP